MDKLGKILIPVSKPLLETNDTLTGDGNNTLLGLNFSAWKFNTDKLLWSGGPQSSIKLDIPLNLYERVMFRLGHNGYGKQFEEYSTNTTRFYLNPLFAKDSANSEVWFETNEWQYGDTKRDLVWQGNCYRRNLKAGGGVFENLNTAVEGYEAEKYPISEVWGVNRIDFNTYNVYCNSTEGGTLTSNKQSGYNGEICTLITTPESEDWKCSALNITGATLTGNDFMFETSDVSAQAEFEHSKDLKLENGDHGVLSADKMSGFSGDIVTVDATTDEGWYFTGLNITGATATGNKFTFVGENVTAEGLYTDQDFPITYLSDEHVQCTGDTTLYIPGGTGITLQTGYDTYYRISGYEVTNGTVENGVLYPTGPCTVRAVATLNYFTATGGWEKGSDVDAVARGGYYEGDAKVPTKYAIYGNHTGDIPSAWWNTSARWNVNSTVSAYQITLNPKIRLQGLTANATGYAYMTATTLLGSAQSNTQTFNFTAPGNAYYDKTIIISDTGIDYGISAHIHAWANDWSYYNYTTARYVAEDTTGTWTATGIAP